MCPVHAPLLTFSLSSQQNCEVFLRNLCAVLQRSDNVGALADKVHLPSLPSHPLPPLFPTVYWCHILPTTQGLLAFLLDGLGVLFSCDSLASLSVYCPLSPCLLAAHRGCPPLFCRVLLPPGKGHRLVCLAPRRAPSSQADLPCVPEEQVPPGREGGGRDGPEGSEALLIPLLPQHRSTSHHCCCPCQPHSMMLMRCIHGNHQRTSPSPLTLYPSVLTQL